MEDKPQAESKKPVRMPTGSSGSTGFSQMEVLLAGSGTSKHEVSSLDLYGRDFVGAARRPAVTFGSPRMSGGGGGDVVVCEVTSSESSGATGLQVDVFKVNSDSGELEKDGTGTLVLTEVVLGAKIPKGSRILGHRGVLYGYESRSE